MALNEDPFCPDARLDWGCNCDMPEARARHCKVHSADTETAIGRAVETAVMKALFPVDDARRRFLAAVSGSTALAALSTLFPLGAATALAQDSRLPLERKNLTVGFLPITCATPLITTIGSGLRPLRVAAMQNVNGNAITMHVKHKDRRDPKQWKGMTLGTPFEFSHEH